MQRSLCIVAFFVVMVAEKQRQGLISQEKQRMAVQAAKLYYEKDRSQAEISKEMNVSRPYVSKLLKLARSSGIVEIRIQDPEEHRVDVTDLQDALCRDYHLEQAVVVPWQSENPLSELGNAAAKYLHSILRDGDIIATSWGNTLHAVSEALIFEKNLKKTLYVQLCGGVSSVHSAVHANEIATGFSEALDCHAYLLPAPAIVGSKELKELLMAEPDLHRVMEYAAEANIALFTVGSFGSDNALVQAGYLSSGEMESLVQKGAVGDLCAHVINSAGMVCDSALDERTIALPLAELRKKRYRIGIAQGEKKIESIRAALQSEIMNVLITNVETAEQLLAAK
jgi:deoxyribonucleoside regulator